MKASPMTFAQLLKRISFSVDSVPLIGSLTTAAVILAGYISFQFAVRPDFKVLRLSSNRVEGINKPLPLRGNHLLWVVEPRDEIPTDVKNTLKQLRADF